MAYTTVPKSTAYFEPEIYTGSGSSKTISTLNFQSDFTWIKNRATTDMHSLFDAVRGATKRISTNIITPQATEAQDLTAFNTNGFTVGTSGAVNTNNVNYASWNWKANGQGSSNTDGTINSTYTSASVTSGFSIVTYTGNGTGGATVGHGLGVAPKVVWVKSLGASGDWRVYNFALGSNASLILNGNGPANSDVWNNTDPSSTVFSISNNSDVNSSGGTYIAYCFAEKQGFSKVGKYTGNGNADGPFVYTGFKPTCVIYKLSSGTDNWRIIDNKRLGYNPNNAFLFPNIVQAESNLTRFELLSNGFKLTTTDNGDNGNNQTYIYMAFGQTLVGTNNVPANAR